MKKSVNSLNFIDMVNEIIETGRKREILQLYTQDEFFDGRNIRVKNKQLINFGSCSYLGLELDERLKIAAIAAIQKYGIQFSSSRSYLSFTLYEELEELVRKIFNSPILLTPTITLGHQAVIPTIIEQGDAIILDQQVHASVQYPATNMQLKGIPVSVIRHSNIEELERAINRFSTANRIWYMADGIYSMYGDYAPMDKLEILLNKYPQLNLYLDDAHGMSWTGKSGCGYALSHMTMGSRMVIGTSFAKGFGTGGGAFIFNDEQVKQKIRNCGPPLIFSGPNQIPVVAASIASAKIHLSDEIILLQRELQTKISYCQELLQKYELPVVSNSETPIKFIALGSAGLGYNMVQRMMESGFYCNLAIFPAVPETCTGLRFTINLHQTYEDIENLVKKLSFHLPLALKNENKTTSDIYRNFRKSFTHFKENSKHIEQPFRLYHERSIEAFEKGTWNLYLGNDNAYDWDGLKFLESTFKNNVLPENNWEFHYYVIKDLDDQIVCVTFFTVCLNKDDLFSPSYISYQLEQTRKNDPYYLCSKTFMMGTPLTEGTHLYLDRSKDWKTILLVLLHEIGTEQEKSNIGTLCLRDFPCEDTALTEFFQSQGFLKMPLPDTHVMNITWNSEQTYLQQFNSRDKWYLKDNVLKYEDLFITEVLKNKNPTPDQINTWYGLYKNVKDKSFDLNTFDLPKKVFENMINCPFCEIIQLKLRSSGKIVGVSFNFRTESNNFCGVLIGLDYNYLKTHSVYKQTLYQSIVRAGMMGCKKMFLGFMSSQVKKKLGAKAISQVGFIQMQDHYSWSVINSLPNNSQKFEK